MTVASAAPAASLLSLMTHQGSRAVFSTAEAAQTVRLPLPDAVTAVSACNLAETERTPLPCEDGVLDFPIRPVQIRTFFLELRSNH